MAGRPTKLTKENQEIICKAVENGATYRVASLVAGVGYSTFNDWMKAGREAKRKNKYSEFSEAVERASAKCEARMAEAIVIAGKSDWRAAESFLKRRDPENWGDKQTLDHQSKGEKIQQISDQNYDRSISTLADAIRESISGSAAKQNGDVDTAE
jgi:hypothetical protein